MQVFTFDFVPYGKDLTGRLKYPVGRENYESEVAAKTYENHVEQFQLMEEVGFDGVCLNEHHGSPYSLDNSPNLFLAYVAAKTKRIKLAMAGNLLPLHGHPLRVAEELAMLDNLTRGRIIAGFVRGIPREYLALSIPLREGRPRFEEALDVILKAWTHDLLNHDGQFYHYKDVDMWPRPYQNPHPPVWVGAIGPEPTRNVVVSIAAHEQHQRLGLLRREPGPIGGEAATLRPVEVQGKDPSRQPVLAVKDGADALEKMAL